MEGVERLLAEQACAVVWEWYVATTHAVHQNRARI